MAAAAGRILVTGFEAFGSDDVNPTSHLVAKLDGLTIADHEVTGAVLPVAAAEGPRSLERMISDHRPSVVLSLGLANGHSQLAVERVAINLMDFPIADNAGSQPAGDPIVPEGPAAYFATIPVMAIAAEWRQAGIPGYVSNTAGTFLCNAVMYTGLHLARSGSFRAGFVHVPYLPEQVVRKEEQVPSMSFEVMLEGVVLAIEVCARAEAGAGVPASALT